MSLSLLTNPAKTINSVSSNVVHAISQLPYEFKREDLQYDSLFTVAGTHLVFNFADTTIYDFNLGDSIYFDADGGIAGYPDGLRGVGVIDSLSPTIVRIPFVTSTAIPDTPTIPSTSRYINLLTARTTYTVEIQIEDIENSQIIANILVYKPAQNGRLFVDMGDIITLLNEQHGTRTFQYRLLYREVFVGNDPAFSQDVIILANLSERGIGQEGGSNAWLHLLKADNSPTYPAGKLLTNFIHPKKWRGWTQTIQAIMDDNFTVRTGFNNAQWIEQPLDVNKASAGATDITQFGNVDVKQHSLSIVDQAESNAEYNRIRVREADVGSTILSKSYDFKYENECSNPIMLSWINSLGGVDYYQFSISQEVNYGATEGQVFQEPITEDIENVHRTLKRLSSDQTLRLLLIAENIPQEDLRALHEIKTSEDVQAYLTKDGTKTVGVVVLSNLISTYLTRGAKGDKTATFTLTIDFPEDYNFMHIKEY